MPLASENFYVEGHRTGMVWTSGFKGFGGEEALGG